ncbi:17-beta-hydroxysteroid dehydrogenase type 2 isoform X2 [Nelusetta ayraudi]
MGLTVFAGVLDADGAGAQRLKEQQQQQQQQQLLQVLQLDVTDSAQVEAAHRHISRQVADTGLWALVNNAGVLLCPVDAEIQPLADYRRCMDVNFLAAVGACQVFLPLLRRSRGRVINVSSLAGEVPMPTFAAYGASKAALAVFSRAMRLELSQWGVEVVLIQPAGFRTNIFGDASDVARHRERLLAVASPAVREDYGEAYISALPDTLTSSAQQVALDLSPVIDAMQDALLAARPRPLYTPGQMAWLLPTLQRCCPAPLVEALTTRIVTCPCRPAGLGKN